MRILLDECVPRSLKRDLSGHDVRTVREMGWSGKKKGELLQLMVADGFEVFLTVDQNILHQQNLSTVNGAVLVLVAPTNRRSDLLPLVPAALSALTTIQPGDLIEVR
jgi:hypothetical protein